MANLFNMLRSQWPLWSGWSGTANRTEYWLGTGRYILVLVFGFTVMNLFNTYANTDGGSTSLFIGQLGSVLVKWFLVTVPIYMARLCIRRGRDAGGQLWLLIFLLVPFVLPFGIVLLGLVSTRTPDLESPTLTG